MRAAGIDTDMFKPHSTRAASASAAYSRDTPIDIILQTAGWKSTCTFATFYKKPVHSSTVYGEAVLSDQKKQGTRMSPGKTAGGII